ncbi:unnamed protein product [Acanthoscelides obtectus]|uniref:RRM domain-containing protein n=1 Tax=Acanthoscelides obtectus TaxID=200917 RepID=A0A9P0NZZ7_ACAOB|nr:unnamed protein product [Acanthoscelides obtectus]CAK1654170.1 Hrp65 protein [Acanthoscelides obtectus]
MSTEGDGFANVQPDAKEHQEHPNQNQRFSRGHRKSDFEIVVDKLRQIQIPAVDLPPNKYNDKFLGRYRLYIHNLAKTATQDDIKELLKPYGEIGNIFLQNNKTFALVQMDYYYNALRAKSELHGTMLKERKIYISFSPFASIVVKNLSPFVTNEYLHLAFSVFGDIEFCCVFANKRGKSTGEGLVDFVKRGSVVLAKRLCSENPFFLTASLRPIEIEDYVPPLDTCDGLSEDKVRNHPQLYQERQFGPRFACDDTFERMYAGRFRELRSNFNSKMEQLKLQLQEEEKALETELMQAKYDYETERLKEIIRQRETERERLWIQNREDNSYRPPDNLFHQASQLSSILDVEERKIQVSLV